MTDAVNYRLNKLNLNKDNLPIVLVDFKLIDTKLFYLVLNLNTKEYRLYCDYVLETNRHKDLTSLIIYPQVKITCFSVSPDLAFIAVASSGIHKETFDSKKHNMIGVSALMQETPIGNKLYQACDAVSKSMQADDSVVYNIELIFVKKDKKKKDKTYLIAYSSLRPSNAFVLKLSKTDSGLSLQRIFAGDNYNMPNVCITISPILNNLFILMNNQTIKFMFRKKKKNQTEEEETNQAVSQEIKN